MYIAIALVIIAVLFSYKPPTMTFNFHKTFTIIQQPIETPSPGGLSDTELKLEIDKMNKERPPTLDDVVGSINTMLHGFEQEVKHEYNKD